MLDMKIVDIQTENDTIYGTIICALCENENKSLTPKRVYYRETTNNSFWVLSNFQKHLSNVHHLNPIKTATRSKKRRKCTSTKNLNDHENTLCNDSDVLFVEEEVDVEMIDENVKESLSNENNWLYIQLADQITEMISANFTTRNEEDQMFFKIDKSSICITVARIKPDGSCLYGSLAHQLYQHATNSTEHEQATKSLRAEVVEYILKPNIFPSFQHALQDRVYETKTKSQITNIESECKFFARYVLSKKNKWGGHETIKAVSEIHQVNIVVFNENGTCMIQHNAQTKYNRTIAVAYRLGYDEHGNEIRNHYDSVLEISSADIYISTEFLINRMK